MNILRDFQVQSTQDILSSSTLPRFCYILDWLKEVMVGMVLWAFFLGVLLHAAGPCNGGITSHFVRKEGAPVDMPFDSDVFQVPEGYNAPQQVVLFLLFFVMLVG